MGRIKVRLEGKKVIVETDYQAAGVQHEMLHKDSRLIAAMKNHNISEVEGSSDNLFDTVYDDFDRKFSEKTGRKGGYPFWCH
jgi:hypothetical protein